MPDMTPEEWKTRVRNQLMRVMPIRTIHEQTGETSVWVANFWDEYIVTLHIEEGLVGLADGTTFSCFEPTFDDFPILEEEFYTEEGFRRLFSHFEWVLRKPMFPELEQQKEAQDDTTSL